MDANAGPLAMGAGGLVVAALALARTGHRHSAHRGWRLWVAALVTGAGVLAAVPWAVGTPWATAVLQALVVVWAPLWLIGLRQFNARLGLPASRRLDGLVLVGGALAALQFPGPSALVVHLYVAALMWSSRIPQDTGALRLLGLTIGAAAFPTALQSWVGGGTPLLTQAAASGLALMVAAFVALTMMGDRTERELRESRRRLRVLANTDPLTQTPNRRHFQELAARRLHSAPGEPTVMLVFDIDHFKLINDRLGHAAGDRALRLVGRCMQEALRAHDVAGRLGGDEFALMVSGATVKQAIGVASRIVEQLQAQSADHRLPVLGMSFGLVEVAPGESVDEALHRADQALYEAKRQGRSCVVAAQGTDAHPSFSESQRLGLTTG